MNSLQPKILLSSILILISIFGVSDTFSYSSGDRVTVGGIVYECKPWPYTGWCGQGGVYSPGIGSNWADAWIVVTDSSNGANGGSSGNGTASSTPVNPPVSSNNSQLKPGIPNIAWIDIYQNENFSLIADMWWGENGTVAKLLDGDTIISTISLSPNSPNAQKISFSLQNQSLGNHFYTVQLCNMIGCSTSTVQKITVFSGTVTQNSSTTNLETPTIPVVPTTPPSDSTIVLTDYIKNVVLAARPLPGIPVVDITNPANNKSNVQRVMRIVSMNKWVEMFPAAAQIYTYEEFLKAVAKFPYLCGEPNETDAVCAKELATIFAHITQETGGHSPQSLPGFSPTPAEWQQGLYYVREMGCSENGAGCEYRGGTCDPTTWQGKTWPCADGKKYYGRGAKQLSYNYNYGMFSDVMFGDPRILLSDPDRIGREGWLAISSAIWFYMTPQSPKPSMHDVVVGKWIPNIVDQKANIRPGFGSTINVINGGIECGGDSESPQARNRISYYKSFSKALGVIPEDDGFLGCSRQQQFSDGGAGAINTYWERDWGKNGACKLVAYQTPFSLFKEKDYEACVFEHFRIRITSNPVESNSSSSLATTTKGRIVETKPIIPIKDTPKLTKKEATTNQILLINNKLISNTLPIINLSVGNNGTAVKNLQIWLKQKGYFPYEPTSYFGGKMKRALLKFQNEHGIPQTGKWDMVTREFVGKMM